MSPTNFILDAVLRESGDYPSAEERERAKAKYLETVLAAVLRQYQPEGGVLTVDVLDAAKRYDVFIQAVSPETAVLIWTVDDEVTSQ